ncbi:DNA polymerase epsilon subunit 3-like [Sinocyclocheilus grahami]|uniref:DNA polymerase epsilon subunit 3 n=1 Tax=Sinocyclocheilus grahami TaxID=75366 RepID=A0A672LW61_SINGR|nr:PREDICTED: DNA polymerase epsilon subunit 3-like [Sinocyclocheilus grahami]XP_016130668.1 PREDICTED: DNA polymerase epsilon subunit 3-like [Sinocyclocheilus grahami]
MAERPEDLNLPNAVITRIIKEALPDGVNVSKEARRAISQAASVFVLYATSCANNFAMKAKRKTLNAGDVMSAMEEMEFERFLQPLREALEAYKKGQKGKKEASEQKRKDKEKNSTDENDKSRDEEDEQMDEQEGENEGEEEDVEN